MLHIVAHLVPCCRHSFGRVQSYTPSFAPWQNTTCLSRRSVAEADAHAISQNCIAASFKICGNENISAFFVSTKKRERTGTNGNERKRTVKSPHRYPPLPTVSYRYFFRCWTLTCAMCSENPPSSTNLSNFLQISFFSQNEATLISSIAALATITDFNGNERYFARFVLLFLQTF